MIEVYKPNLKLLSAFYCGWLAPGYDERFQWAMDEAWHDFDYAKGDPLEEVGFVLALAESAPNEGLLQQMSTSVLEDMVKYVVESKDLRFSNALMQYPQLKVLIGRNLLPSGIDEKILQLSNDYEGEPIPPIECDFGLQILTPKQVCGFWCFTCVPKIGFEYADGPPEELELYYYEDVHSEVLRLLNKTASPSAVLADLKYSAPDQQALKVVGKIAYQISDRDDMNREMLRDVLPYVARRDQKGFKHRFKGIAS